MCTHRTHTQQTHTHRHTLAADAAASIIKILIEIQMCVAFVVALLLLLSLIVQVLNVGDTLVPLCPLATTARLPPWPPLEAVAIQIPLRVHLRLPSMRARK